MNHIHKFTSELSRFILLPALVAMLLVSGCSIGIIDAARSFRYYFPTSDRVYPPKPKNAMLPVFSDPPKRPYTVIGTMNYTVNPDEMNRLYRILQMNGRSNGADAIIAKITHGTETATADAQMIVFK